MLAYKVAFKNFCFYYHKNCRYYSFANCHLFSCLWKKKKKYIYTIL